MRDHLILSSMLEIQTLHPQISEPRDLWTSRVIFQSPPSGNGESPFTWRGHAHAGFHRCSKTGKRVSHLSFSWSRLFRKDPSTPRGQVEDKEDPPVRVYIRTDRPEIFVQLKCLPNDLCSRFLNGVPVPEICTLSMEFRLDSPETQWIERNVRFNLAFRRSFVDPPVRASVSK